MIVKKLKNGFTRYKCSYCGYQEVYHRDQSFSLSYNAVTAHEKVCVRRTDRGICRTCKHGIIRGDGVMCSITMKCLSPPVDTCWTPIKNLGDRIYWALLEITTLLKKRR